MGHSDLIAELRSLLEETPTYLAIKLDKPSRKALRKWWLEETGLPLLPNIHSHHVTLKFQPTADEVEKAALGAKVAVEVVGWVADEKAQAVKVTIPVKTTNRVPHVTVATARGTPPVYSNKLSDLGVSPVRGPILSGTIEHLVQDD